MSRLVLSVTFALTLLISADNAAAGLLAHGGFSASPVSTGGDFLAATCNAPVAPAMQQQVVWETEKYNCKRTVYDYCTETVPVTCRRKVYETCYREECY